MTVTAKKAIQFECEECGHFQYGSYSLEGAYYKGRVVNEDHIMCKQCGHDNHVIEEP